MRTRSATGESSAHNGIVDAPKSYAVDSQYLFDRLNQCNGDYQEAFQGIDGWWGLSWFNGERFYLQAYGNDVAIGRLDGSYYYSSDWRHLEAVGVKQNTIRILEWGDTIAFDCKSKGYEELSAFVDMSPLLAACALDSAHWRDKWREGDEWEARRALRRGQPGF